MPDPYYYEPFTSALWTIDSAIVRPPWCPLTYKCEMISKAKENDQDLCAYEDDKTSSTFNQFEGTFNFTSSDTERYGTSVLPFKIIASSGQSSDEVTILLNLAILIEEGIKVSTESEGRAQEVGDAS